ncbi:RNA polymerase subunit AC19 [Thelotrema lepadinum]|nr:RNA polymerase subunit AC19 [Thelotrema lepadinum]
MPSQTPANEFIPNDQNGVDGTEEDVPVGTGDVKIRALPGFSENAASFEFLDEDHTMGNALRYMIMKNPEVEFCGYSIPHPAEAKMNIRIQTYEGTTVWEALQKGLDDLVDLCDVVEEKFIAARDEFNAERMEE